MLESLSFLRPAPIDWTTDGQKPVCCICLDRGGGTRLSQWALGNCNNLISISNISRKHFTVDFSSTPKDSQKSVWSFKRLNKIVLSWASIGVLSSLCPWNVVISDLSSGVLCKYHHTTYTRCPQKKRAFRMLLEPQCTGSITICQYPLCLEIDFLVVSY